MSDQAVLITPELYAYACSNSSPAHPALIKLYNQSRLQPGGHMVSSMEQVNFIQVLVKATNAKKMIELGTFTGLTSLALALSSSEDAKVFTCDIHANARQIGEPYWHETGVYTKIVPIIMPALSFLDELILRGEANSVDLAYIDADKKNYYAYFEKLLFLMRSGGLIIADNVLWKGDVLNKNDELTQAIRDFNAKISNDARVMCSLLPLGDGLMLIYVK